MPKKNSYITVTDQFCGAGGSSQGAKRVLDKVGGKVKLALNHWKLAIETHNTNFPDTLHDCTDVSASDPRRYPSTDILITSPECTTHSPAGGNNHKALKKQMDMFDTGVIDPSTERSRATMWDVCRFAEYHHYNAIIVENVVEAKTRWPLFDVWLTAMHKLGYEHNIVTNEAWNSFISAYNNGSHCTKHFTEELPTQATRDRNALVTYQQPKIEDCYYRMLKPFEVKLAMAFDPTYVILGNGRDQVKQCGNAVTPPSMEWLVGRVVESLN